MAKGKGGFIGHDGLNAPDSPTNVSASAGAGSADVSFTAPTDVGGSSITGYRVQDSTNAHGASGSSSPVTVTGLTNGTSYTFNVWAINAFGYSSPSGFSASVTPSLTRAYWIARTTVNLHYSDITTTGNTTDWGANMRYAAYNTPTMSSSSRAVVTGFENSSAQAHSTYIEQMNLSSAGTSTLFGELAGHNAALRGFGLSNGTRGCFSIGYEDTTIRNTIEYVTIASAGNATDFGDMTQAVWLPAACASPTRGMIGGGNTGSTRVNRLEYITIASTGNATDTGDLISDTDGLASCSSSTRGLWCGGDINTGTVNKIEYQTIASGGNSSDFGDLTNTLRYGGAGCSEIRALIAGEFSGNTNGIDYVTIASTGNATDFGDLLNNENNGLACASTAHGGLQ